MNDHYIFVDDDVDIRQGDIILRKHGIAEGNATLGLILTADCDIAQNKMNDRFTWLEIVRASAYLENDWAASQVRRIVAKHSKAACEVINSIIRRKQPELTSLSPSSLCEWLAEANPMKFSKLYSRKLRRRMKNS